MMATDVQMLEPRPTVLAHNGNRQSVTNKLFEHAFDKGRIDGGASIGEFLRQSVGTYMVLVLKEGLQDTGTIIHATEAVLDEDRLKLASNSFMNVHDEPSLTANRFAATQGCRFRPTGGFPGLRPVVSTEKRFETPPDLRAEQVLDLAGVHLGLMRFNAQDLLEECLNQRSPGSNRPDDLLRLLGQSQKPIGIFKHQAPRLERLQCQGDTAGRDVQMASHICNACIPVLLDKLGNRRQMMADAMRDRVDLEFLPRVHTFSPSGTHLFLTNNIAH
jgi:hypothetical protein